MKTVFLFVLFLFAFSACHKDNSASEGLYRTWEVMNFMSIESVAYPKNENVKILLTFEKMGDYRLKLDINSCGGTFDVDSNQLKMESPACTEACCDSKFSEKTAAMLSRITSFETDGKTLKLNIPQWGYIELRAAD